MDAIESEAPREGGRDRVNLARTVRDRSVTRPSCGANILQSRRLREYAESRFKVRARVELSSDASIFTMKFLPEPIEEKAYCIVEHGSRAQVWDMTGAYSRRKPGQMHGAKMLMDVATGEDVTCLEWMPTRFSQAFYPPPLPASREENAYLHTEKIKLPPFFSSGLDKRINMFREGVCVATLTDQDQWVRFMSVCNSGDYLLSGSAFSSLFGWDIATLKPIWKIDPAHVAPDHLLDALQGVNSINGLEWAHDSSTIFASGAGDGSIKLWDTRILDSLATANSCVNSLVAHDAKLNNLHWLQDNRFLMTSGRDNVIRLLDMRMLKNTLDSQLAPSKAHMAPWYRNQLILHEYAEHDCGGYSLQAKLYDRDERIVTGSGSGRIYIYETWTGRLVETLLGGEQTNHLVLPLPTVCGPGFLSASAASSKLYVWGSSSTTEHTSEENLSPQLDMSASDVAISAARQEALQRTVSTFQSSFAEALRNHRPYDVVFLRNDFRATYHSYLMEAIERRGIQLPNPEPGVLRDPRNQQRHANAPLEEFDQLNPPEDAD